MPKRGKPKPNRAQRKGVKTGALPPVIMVRVVGMDDDGPVAQPVKDDQAPKVHILDPKAQLGLGQKALVKLIPADGAPTAKILKVFAPEQDDIIGVVHKVRKIWHLTPAQKSAKRDLVITDPPADLKDGAVVRAKPIEDPRYGLKKVQIIAVVGHQDDARVASTIAMATHDIPMGFSTQVEDEAKRSAEQPLTGDDLTHIPFITIDPPDAKDHDDAVYAEVDPGHKGGMILWVAIADVARYVKPDSAVDARAQEKGVSVYFPDRVEPMLPHSLSSDACSLRPDVKRAAMVLKIHLDAEGHKRKHIFMRGIITSRARLSYQQAQDAFDNKLDDTTKPINNEIIKPLKKCFDVLLKARERRNPLNINSIERTIKFDKNGQVDQIVPRKNLPTNRMIEEMMVLSNVCAAETLEEHNIPVIYRIHDRPDGDKVMTMATVLATFNIDWSQKEVATTARFNRVLNQIEGAANAQIVNEVILRSQSQAVYATDNIGHFGLNLPRYAHFTSPIRRYADVMVHRGLIRALKLGDDGLTDTEMAKLSAIAQDISTFERRAVAAERDATDRYLATYLADKVGAEFTGTIVGLTRFGMFVRLTDTGADGLIPARTLGRDMQFYEHHAAFATRGGQAYRLGDTLDVLLEEATPITGGLLLSPITAPTSQIKLRKSDFVRAPRGYRDRRDKNKGGHKGKRTHKKNKRK